MTVAKEISRARTIAASASLAAAGLGWLGAFHAGGAVVAAFAGVLALAAAGIARRSVLPQILSRGVAWLALCAGVIATIVDRHPTLDVLAVTVGAAAALVLSRPLLHTAHARAEFAPLRFRRIFLAAATGAVTFASVAGAGALELLGRDALAPGLGWLAITAGLLGAAVGVARMRAWGVLLGVLTSTAMLLAAALLPGWREPLLVLAAPGALLALPVVLARLGAGGADQSDAPAPAVRLAAFAPPAARIAGEDAGHVAEEDAAMAEAGGEVLRMEGRA